MTKKTPDKKPQSKEKLKVDPKKVGVLSDEDLNSVSGGLMRREATDAGDSKCNTDGTSTKCSGATC